MSEQTPPAPETTTPEDAPKSNRSAMFIVFLVVFIDLLGFGIVIPLLPVLADGYLAQLIPGGKNAPLGGVLLGLLMASFSAMQFFFAPLWGRVSDRVGRKPILLVGLAGSFLFYGLFGYALELPQDSAGLAITLLFVCRMGQGIAGATIATAQAVIADTTTPEKRKHGMALIGAAFGIGFTFGPLMGAGLLFLFPNFPGIIGFAAAGFSLLALVLGIRMLPETRSAKTDVPRREVSDVLNLFSVMRSPAVGPVILTFFLVTLGFGSLESTTALINRDALNFNARYNFLIFAYIGFVLMLTQGYLYRKLAKKLEEVTFMVIGIVLMGIGVVTLSGVSYFGATSSLAGSPLLVTWTMVSYTAATVGFAFLTPSAQALISRRSSADRQGEILGANQSASALARILGPFLGLTLYKLTTTHILPFVLGGLLILLMLPLIPRIRRGDPGDANNSPSEGDVSAEPSPST